ncbi:MAG TPA: hypothetical protein VF190_11235 [Rhodothermales bacterium]
MNTNLLLSVTAAFLALAGLTCTFLPQELLALLGEPSVAATTLVVQIAGALYLGFALLNWMVRRSPIGGIYGRPITVGNFLHFLMVALAAWKSVGSIDASWVITGAVIYTLFAFAFGYLMFMQPRSVAAASEP